MVIYFIKLNLLVSISCLITSYINKLVRTKEEKEQLNEQFNSDVEEFKYISPDLYSFFKEAKKNEKTKFSLMILVSLTPLVNAYILYCSLKEVIDTFKK